MLTVKESDQRIGLSLSESRISIKEQFTGVPDILRIWASASRKRKGVARCACIVLSPSFEIFIICISNIFDWRQRTTGVYQANPAKGFRKCVDNTNVHMQQTRDAHAITNS